MRKVGHIKIRSYLCGTIGDEMVLKESLLNAVAFDGNANEGFAGDGCSPLHEQSCIRTTHHTSIPYDLIWWNPCLNDGRVRT